MNDSYLIDAFSHKLRNNPSPYPFYFIYQIVADGMIEFFGNIFSMCNFIENDIFFFKWNYSLLFEKSVSYFLSILDWIFILLKYIKGEGSFKKFF